jgi:hypothetical protein
MDSLYKNESYIYNLLLNNDEEFKNIYNYQIKLNNNTDYTKYLTYLDTYYKLESKKDKYSKDFRDGFIILLDKKDSKKKIKISATIFVDINELYIILKNFNDNILLKISLLVDKKTNITDENRKEFEELKNKYLLFKTKLNEIDEINKVFYENIDNLINEKIKKTNDLDKYYQKRILDYKKIELMISEKIKNSLIVLFNKNSNKIPNDNDIKNISKKSDIPYNEVEKWFEWIETTYFYLIVKKEVTILEEKIKEKEFEYEMNMKNMILKFPKIE